LSGSPSPRIAVLAQVFNDQAHVLQGAHACVGVPEPKAFREELYQAHRLLDELRPCLASLLMPFIVCIGHQEDNK
jgi:hypothetical protein